MPVDDGEPGPVRAFGALGLGSLTFVGLGLGGGEGIGVRLGRGLSTTWGRSAGASVVGAGRPGEPRLWPPKDRPGGRVG